MNLIDNLRRMITPVSNEDEDYDLDFAVSYTHLTLPTILLV